MLYNIYHRITINGDVKMETFNSLMINNDINELTDTCNITFPYTNFSLTAKKLLMKTDAATDIEITKGDTIKVELAHYQTPSELLALQQNPNLSIIFDGYIKGFSVDKDLATMNCEDAMYLFKQKKINFSYGQKLTSVDLFIALLDEYGLTSTFSLDNIQDISLGKLNTRGYETAAEVFQRLRDDYKYFTYFKIVDNQPVLYFGLKYPLTETSDIIEHKFSYPYDNQYYTIVQNGLNYETFDKENELIVIGVYIDNVTNKNTKLATINGTSTIEDNGKIEQESKLREIKSEINMHTTDTIALGDLVKQSWLNHPESGFEGTFTTFGTPLVRHGEIVNLKIEDGFGDFIYESYYVDSVVSKITPNAGFIADINIGSKIN